MLKIRRLLVANRSEIAIRVFRAANELGISTVAIYADQDKLSLHRFKADEAFALDPAKGPVEAYLAIDDIIEIARQADVDAIHPGYGLLSENPDFADACEAAGILFIGPTPAIMRALGDKISARQIAQAAGVPVVPASNPLPYDDAAIEALARDIGYPLMLKASWGGGGRGMRPIHSSESVTRLVHEARREAKSAFGRDEVYFEKLIHRAMHVEVQLLGDHHGNLVHLYERDCTIQRRNQKVVERAPAPYLSPEQRDAICDAALRIGRHVGFSNAGTVEFLIDKESGSFYFIEVNPRIQVEHTITEVVTGLDIVKAQIRIAEGARIGSVDESGIPAQAEIRLNGHAIQCRVTTENPDNNFIPDYGRITAYRGAFGPGIRIDGGTAYEGAVVTRYYDPLLEKIIAWAPRPDEAVACMLRAVREYRIRGVATNLAFLESLLSHGAFRQAEYTTKFIDDTPELLNRKVRRDRATKLLAYIGEVTINGHPDVKDRAKADRPTHLPKPLGLSGPIHAGTRQTLEALGARRFADWIRSQERVLVTDTTMRDAHQSLLATRMRTYDMERIAADYARAMPHLLSLECWGGATFDVAMRFLQEDPWERIAAIRSGAPNLLTQMLFRGANAVGYTNYPDNVVRRFIEAAADHIDIFRIFDCFNWVENMRFAIEVVAESGKIAQGAICYTGNLLDPAEAKYSPAYYATVARELDRAGCHMLAIKDMAGLLTPAAVRKLIAVVRDVTDLPLQLHTHDTSGAGAATLIAAAEAGVDAIDAAVDSFSGLTSQPCMGAVAAAMRHGPRDTRLEAKNITALSSYWEGVRDLYAPFESELRSGASEVFLHEMPGGQFTNLKEQARSVGLSARWHEVAQAYHDANTVLGNIIKVTPSSKVVGDMALMMVSQGISGKDIADGRTDIAFPVSVKSMLRGDLGQPHDGFPAAIKEAALRGEPSYTCRPADLLPPQDLDLACDTAAKTCGRALTNEEFVSYLMYPEVTAKFVARAERYGPVSRLPTSCFFYGMQPGEQISVAIERGKILDIVLVAIGDLDPRGQRKLFFELNGQPRSVTVVVAGVSASANQAQWADESNASHVAAPMPGMITAVSHLAGSSVKAGDRLFSVEAMKMEAPVLAQRDGTIARILVQPGDAIEAKQLLCIIE